MKHLDSFIFVAYPTRTIKLMFKNTLPALLFGLLLFISSGIDAQITITQQHMPSAGDTIRYSIAGQGATGDFQSTGANYNWDFSGLEPSSQGIYEYKSSLQTPYILSFGFTAIGLKIADTLGTGQLQLKNVYNFFKKSSTAYEGVGLGFQYSALPLPQSGKHSDPERIYKFPMTYGSKDTDTYSVNIPLSLAGFPVGSLTQMGTRTSEVDGWGTITTPYGQNISCIRIASQIDAYDSISISTLGVNTAIQNQRTEYKWLSTSEKIPILEITGTWAGRTFIPAFIRYRDIPRNLTSPLQVKADFAADKTEADQGDTVRFSNNSSGFNLSYSWSLEPKAGFQFINGTGPTSDEPELRFDSYGKYSVKLVVSNQLQSDSLLRSEYLNVQARIPGTVGDLEYPHYRISPNPSAGVFRVTDIGPDDSFRYEILDAKGSVYTQGIIPANGQIHIPFLADGAYVFKMSNGVSSLSRTLLVNRNSKQ